jgi:GNAT superfamily N-acetyltransferase
LGDGMSVSYRRSGVQDASLIRDFWIEHWAGDFVVAHGENYHPDGLEGFIALDGSAWVGLVTYKILGGECEIISLDSLREGEGIGSSLIEQVAREAKKAGCARLFLVTTNDNLEALGFYQKRGFELVRVNRGAVNRSRQIKPAIPLIGLHGIPLRDEIELEMTLDRK